jgi:prepilin-type N-terminal cleavage/methylation domain-containing protein
VDARGVTLIELIVAVTVLAVGVLAVAGSAPPLARLVRWGGVRAAAAEAAGAAIETARGAGCDAGAGGASAGHGMRLSWSLAGSGELRQMTVVATYPWGSGARSDTFVAAIPCSR